MSSGSKVCKAIQVLKEDYDVPEVIKDLLIIKTSFLKHIARFFTLICF